MGVDGGNGARKRVRLEHDERRGLILAAARRLLSTRPYSEVSTTAIAAEAGVARGLLHHYFGSKRELYLEVVRDVVQVPVIPIPVDDPALRASQVWALSVDRWMALIDANRDLWVAAMGTGGIGHDHEVQAILHESKEHVAVQALAAMGVVEPTPVMLALVRGFGGFTEELTSEWLLRGRLTREQVRTLLVEAMPLLVRELLPHVAAVPSRRTLRPRPSG